MKFYYQICVEGIYKYFAQQGKFYCKTIYKEKPDQREIDKFIDLCCNNNKGQDLMDLERRTISIKINKLEVYGK